MLGIIGLHALDAFTGTTLVAATEDVQGREAALTAATILQPIIGGKAGIGGAGLVTAGIAVIVFGWMGYARIIRGDILSVKERDYVLAARVVGAKDSRILFKHILPNAIFSATSRHRQSGRPSKPGPWNYSRSSCRKARAAAPFDTSSMSMTP